MTAPTAAPSRRRRLIFVAAAVASAAVATVFATVGDGVQVSGGGPRALVVEFGHTLVWVLLAVAFGIAASAGRWTRPANAVSLAALGCYAVFLFAVFVAPAVGS